MDVCKSLRLDNNFAMNSGAVDRQYHDFCDSLRLFEQPSLEFCNSLRLCDRTLNFGRVYESLRLCDDLDHEFYDSLRLYHDFTMNYRTV